MITTEEKLLAYVTHEFGNHLAVIDSTAQLMEKRNPQLHEIQYWDQLRTDIEALRKLFFDFSNYRQGIFLESKETDLIDLADETVESFQSVAEEKKVSVILEEEESLETELLSYVCDGVKLKSVMVNLIKNALEVVKEGEKVWVRVLGKKQTGSDYVEIQVANNGALIEPEAMEHIFDFGVSCKGEKRGIGLALAKKIVENHKGTLKVISEEINGERQTVFSICLPA